MQIRLPDFLVIGAAKGGTTALYDYLKQHPRIFLPKVKEPHFFDNDDHYALGLDWYLREHFSANSDDLIQGEATPSYLRKHDKVIPRIRQAYGRVSPKFLIVLRDPAERAYSHYLHRHRVFVEKEGFERALELEAARLAANPHDWTGYYSEGVYVEQLQAWFSEFPRENFHIVLSEDLKFRRIETLHDICNFLGVPTIDYAPAELVSNQRASARLPWLMKLMVGDNWAKRIARTLVRDNTTKEKIILFMRKANLKPAAQAKMPDPVAKALRARYRSSIEQLERLIDRDLSSWK